jgi:hypothetical protein
MDTAPEGGEISARRIDLSPRGQASDCSACFADGIWAGLRLAVEADIG